jgi:flavin reductase (DIM6/NTAB) family NADH-FMN oxidoreductase RutF
MMILNDTEIVNLERRYRGNFINSLGGFKSVVLVGTKSPQGNGNLATFSSLFHIGADPALCGMVVRPNEERQNTLGNIMSTEYYTINHISPAFYKQAHQCSAKYDEGISEFEQVGLTPEYLQGIYAPFVFESKIKFGCRLVQKINLEINGTYLILGKIVTVVVPEECMNADGHIDLVKAETVTLSGLDAYHTTQKLARLSYAQPNKSIQEI